MAPELPSARLVLVMGLAVYVGAIVGANLLITHFGLINVGFGLVPAGTAMVALSWPARDIVQAAGGRWLSILAIVVGAALSYWLTAGGQIPGAPLPIAAASGLTLLCSESLDWAVFSPMRRRYLVTGVAASGILAGLLDTWLFLYLAGIGMASLAPTFVVKALVVVCIGAPAAFGLRRRLAT